MNLRQQLFAPQELHAMWRACRIFIKNNTAAGVDGVTKQDFEGDLGFELRKISKRVLGGDFGYQPLRPIPIDKGNGKIRIINVPTIADRFVQRCVLHKVLDANSDKWKTGRGFGGLRSESTRDVLNKVRAQAERYRWALKSDISSYFDNIDRSLIKKVVRRKIRHTSLYPLIDGAIDCEPDLSHPNDKKAFADAKLKLGRGVRQGMTLSPLLAYLFLMDEDLTTMPAKFFRYVDDMVFFGDTRQEVEEAFASYSGLLASKGLALAQHKTKLIEPKQTLEFLGIEINRQNASATYSIPKSAKAKVLAAINEACDFNGLRVSKQRGWLARSANRIGSIRRSYEYAYDFCDNWSSFKQEISEAQRHACRLVVRRLQEAAGSSTDKRLLFRLFGVVS